MFVIKITLLALKFFLLYGLMKADWNKFVRVTVLIIPFRGPHSTG